MSQIREEILEANAAYVSDFRKIPIYGYIYQVESGRLLEVPEATAIGRPHVGGAS